MNTDLELSRFDLEHLLKIVIQENMRLKIALEQCQNSDIEEIEDEILD